jgi:glycerol-3-phosphate acyltransferase PlsX
MKIVLDAIGGDHAPEQTVAGAVRAARELGVEVVLVGPRERIAAELAKHPIAGLQLPVVDAPEIIEMDEHPVKAVRRKPQSSVAAGLRLVRDGQADAFVSAGHSGATMAGALFILGRVGNIERPCLTTVFPSVNGRLVVADVGATTDSRPEFLLQFAQMSVLYTRLVLGLERPRVALLANGEEEIKGDKLVQDAHALLKASDLNFVGNAEPKDAMAGDVTDVLIADGFVGNLFLKQAEATAKFALVKARQALVPGVGPRAALGLAPVALLGALSPAPAWVIGAGLAGGPALLAALGAPLYRLRKTLDYRAYGGVPLLGVDGVTIIAHGKSDATAVASAIQRAKEAVDRGLVAAIGQIEAATQTA